MGKDHDTYESPLSGRYSSKEMKKIFSQRERATTWRQLWLWLAESEKELGLTQITDKALDAMRSNLIVTDEDLDTIIPQREKEVRHDVMSHIFAFEQAAPAAEGILHIGATSCYVTDNGDLIHMRNALDLVLPKLAKVISNFAAFALKYKDLPTLSYTHYQPAIPMSMGKRACQWIQELMMDIEDIEHVRAELKFRGAQGTTGTQASYLDIFHGDATKIDKLNELLCEKAGFPNGCYEISTQTYTRKVDLRVANVLSAFGATAIRIGTDIRHLCHDNTVDEIGSSAMPFKMNPMRSERICGLARKLANLNSNFSDTFANQRTLDDSSQRRLDLSEQFLLADAVLLLLDNVSNGLRVFEKTVEAQLAREFPFMVTERIIMKLVHKGVSRQESHERIRIHSFAAVDVVRNQGGQNDLIERIKKDEFFKPVWPDLDAMSDPRQFIGRSAEIVDKYVGPHGPVTKKLQKYTEHIANAATATLSI